MSDTIYATMVFEDPGPATNNKAGGQRQSDGIRQYKARRPHTKSRKGCSTCKIRRLKCDERKPRCGQCIHGDRACIYASSPVTSKSPSHRGWFQTPGVPNQIPADFLDGYSAGISEIWKMATATVNATELLDHFMHTTHHLWIGGSSCQTVLQQHGPRLAVEAPYLRFAMLSFSAYHLATVGSRTEKYELAGAIYYSCALQSYSTALHNPGVADADALLACSVLLGKIAYKNVTSSQQRRGPSPDKVPVPNIIGLQAMAGFQILKGVPALQPKLGQSVMIGQCGKDQPSYLKSVAEYAERLATVEKLERFCNVDGGATTLESVHDAALSSLRLLMLSEVGDGVISTYCFFTRGFDSRFISMLERKDPKALLLLCYWYVMGARIGQWWMVDSAKLDGMKLLNFLRESPSTDIQELLKFPLASLESIQHH